VTPGSDFRTRTGAVGTWPEVPVSWSYSSLVAIESCPRRWMLERSAYPQLANGSGYPSRPSFAAISGSVVHESVEQILAALSEAGCISMRSAAAVEVMRGLGGFPAVIEANCESALARFADDPRAQPMLDPIRRRLEAQKAHLRRRTKRILALVRLAPTPPGDGAGSLGKLRIGKRDGVYPEVSLTASVLRLRGRADLISIDAGTCSITDFKTGEKSEQHAEQLRFYELLWREDAEVNPEGLPIADLLIMYPDSVARVDPLGPRRSASLGEEIEGRIRAAEAEIDQPPSRAIPEAEKCGHCDVRHMCEDYWEMKSLRPDPDEAGPGTFLDCELLVHRRIGARSWEVAFDTRRAVLRTRSERESFEVGARLRILGAAVSRDDDTDALILTKTLYSEAFALDP
jgi:hypothetical protein